MNCSKVKKTQVATSITKVGDFEKKNEKKNLSCYTEIRIGVAFAYSGGGLGVISWRRYVWPCLGLVPSTTIEGVLRKKNYVYVGYMPV